MFPSPRPPPILVLNVVFAKLVPNPICVPHLKLLASTVAEIRRGSQILFGYSLGPDPQNLTVFGDKWGFKIKFKFYNPKKAHPCVISRLLSYRA